MTRLLTLALLALTAYACDINGLPPDLVMLAGAALLVAVILIVNLAIWRWSRG